MRATTFTLGLGIVILSCSGTYAAPPAPTPIINPGENGASFQGCEADSRQNRLLSNRIKVPSGDAGMTVTQCTTACASAGYGLAGVEYGRECWCANYPNYDAPSDRAYRCDMPCAGNPSEVCGGAGAIAVYSVGSVEQGNGRSNDWSFHGCWLDDSVRSRILRHQAAVPGGNQGMTVGKCTAACQAKGYSIAGLEYSQECWCDNEYHSGRAASDFYGDWPSCYMPCRGNPSQTCGGQGALSVYTFRNQQASTNFTNECVENAIITLGRYQYRQKCEGLYEYPFLDSYWPGTKADRVKRCDDWDECVAFEFYGDSCSFFGGDATIIWTYNTQVLRKLNRY